MPRRAEPAQDAGDSGWRARHPVWARGRFGRFVGGLYDYLLIGWWGLVRPRVSERKGLELSQAVVLRNGSPNGPQQVLLSIRRDLFGWELPGGTVEEGETPVEALLREVREETGLDVEIDFHVGDWVREGFRPHTAHVFRCRVVGGVLTPSHETPRVGWFDASNPPRGLFPWYRPPLLSALRGEDFAVHREWQGLSSVAAAIRIDLAIRWRGLPAAPGVASSDPKRNRPAD